MKYNVNDILIHKNSESKWIITTKENNEFLLYQLDNDKINHSNKMFLNDLDIFKYFIKKDKYKMFKAFNRLEILFYYLKHYKNDLQPEYIKNDNNYIFYKLHKKDFLREFNINSLIDYNNLDLIYKAKNIINDRI